ncbi:MAG: DUF177 domain-containing protein [Clostridia bacterium]|nr:DUF177 domain-containing protein [Clostridia bacterium]
MMSETESKFLDIAKLCSGEVRSIAFDREDLPFPDEADGIGITHLRFSGQVVDLSGFFRLFGTVSCELSAPCGRCLAPVTQQFRAEVDLAVVTEAVESEEETVLCQGQKIDLGELAEVTLYTNLPMRLLCKEDCKGLCPKCGKDWNKGECSCEQKEIDPRLAGLADFFK